MAAKTKTDDEKLIAVEEEDGRVIVYAAVPHGTEVKLPASASSEDRVEAAAGDSWRDGPLMIPGPQDLDSYKSPKLTIPHNYYRKIAWSEEYYEQEPLVNSLVNREIDQAISDEELHIPEEKEDEAEALEIWSESLNRDIGQNGGLREFNRSMMLDLTLTSLVVTLANWGTVTTSSGKTYKVPRVLVNLSAKSLMPVVDSFSGKREYYYKLSQAQYESIRKGEDSGITQIIPNAKKYLKQDVTYPLNGEYNSVSMSGPWLRIPIEEGYVIQLRARQNDVWPRPTLVPIFAAIAMKRKLALADWAVADGMVNMIMVWEFPPGTKPSAAKNIVTKFMQGGRVQSHAVPAGVKVQLITPDASILNSGQKFWQPMSEIYEHFGFLLSSPNWGAEIDNAGLEGTSNKSRWQFWRDTTSDHNNYWLAQIKKRNGWDFKPEAIFASRDLDNDTNFRTFVSSLYDRGLLSIETMLDLAQTSIERESARRKIEKKEGLQDVFEIRPSYAQQTLPSAGRPPKGSSKSKTEPVGSKTEPVDKKPNNKVA